MGMRGRECQEDESEAVRGLRRHAEAKTFWLVSNGELWKLCEQMHADHYPADRTLLPQKCLLTRYA